MGFVRRMRLIAPGLSLEEVDPVEELTDAVRADARHLGLLLHRAGLPVEVVEDWDEETAWMAVRVSAPSMAVEVGSETGLLVIHDHLVDHEEMERLLPTVLAAIETAVGLVPVDPLDG